MRLLIESYCPRSTFCYDPFICVIISYVVNILRWIVVEIAESVDTHLGCRQRDSSLGIETKLTLAPHIKQ